MGAARLRPTRCLRSTLSTLQAWKKVQSFCEPDDCLFACCCCLGHVQATPGSPVGPVPGAAAVRVHHRPVRCSQDTCDWRQTGEPSLLPAINTKRDGSISAYNMFFPGLGSWPLQPGSQLRPAVPTYFTYIGDQTFQKCN